MQACHVAVPSKFRRMNRVIEKYLGTPEADGYRTIGTGD